MDQCVLEGVGTAPQKKEECQSAADVVIPQLKLLQESDPPLLVNTGSNLLNKNYINPIFVKEGSQLMLDLVKILTLYTNVPTLPTGVTLANV